MVRVKQSRSSIMHCVQKFTFLYISFLKNSGATGKTWRAYWMSSVCGRIVPYFFSPVFIPPLILAAHQGLTSILNVIVVQLYCLYFCLNTDTPYFYQLFLSCVSSLYFYPAFLSPISVLQQFLVILSCISILYLSHPFQVQTDAWPAYWVAEALQKVWRPILTTMPCITDFYQKISSLHPNNHVWIPILTTMALHHRL